MVTSSATRFMAHVRRWEKPSTASEAVYRIYSNSALHKVASIRKAAIDRFMIGDLEAITEHVRSLRHCVCDQMTIFTAISIPSAPINLALFQRVRGLDFSSVHACSFSMSPC
jgi:hypothetical protein